MAESKSSFEVTSPYLLFHEGMIAEKRKIMHVLQGWRRLPGIFSQYSSGSLWKITEKTRRRILFLLTFLPTAYMLMVVKSCLGKNKYVLSVAGWAAVKAQVARGWGDQSEYAITSEFSRAFTNEQVQSEKNALIDGRVSWVRRYSRIYRA